MVSQAALNHCIVAFVLIMTVSACSGHAPAQPAVRSATHVPKASAAAGMTVGDRAAVVAVRQIGVPYRYGGHDAAGFDCSGLVHYAYSKAGKSMPRTTAGLWREMHPVAESELRTGDVLFFDIEGKVSHVGLYLGEQRFVHAPSTGREVSIESLDSDFYRKALIRGGRPR